MSSVTTPAMELSLNVAEPTCTPSESELLTCLVGCRTCMSLWCAVQGLRRRSWDHYAQNVFLYGKVSWDWGLADGTAPCNMYAPVWQQTSQYAACEQADVTMKKRCSECMQPGSGIDRGMLESLESLFGIALWRARLGEPAADCDESPMYANMQITTALTAYQVDVRLLVWYALLCWGEWVIAWLLVVVMVVVGSVSMVAWLSGWAGGWG